MAIKAPELNIDERLDHLQALMQRQTQALADLELEQDDLRSSLNQLMIQKQSNPKHGLIKGNVAVSTNPGDPAVINNQAQVEVEVKGLGLKSQILTCNVALPWLIPQGGIQFLPRQGQAVYLGFLDGLIHEERAPVIVGFQANEEERVPFEPFKQPESEGQPKSSVPLEWGAPGDDWPIEESQNQFKNVIASASNYKDPDGNGFKHKHSQAILCDEEEKASIALGSEGDLNIRADQDMHSLVGGKLHDIVQGETKLETRLGRTSTITGGDTLKVKKPQETQDSNEPEPEEGHGDLIVKVDGDEKHTVSGNYKLEIKGKYKMECLESWMERNHLETDFDYHWGAREEYFAAFHAVASFAPEFKLFLDAGLALKISGFIELIFGESTSVFLGLFNTWYLGVCETRSVKDSKQLLADFTKSLVGVQDAVSVEKRREALMHELHLHMDDGVLKSRNGLKIIPV